MGKGNDLVHLVRGSEAFRDQRLSDRRGRDESDDALPLLCMPASPSQTFKGRSLLLLISLVDIRMDLQGMMKTDQTVGPSEEEETRPGAVQPRCPWSCLLFAAAKRQDAQLQQSEIFDSRPGRRRPFLEPLTNLHKQTQSCSDSSS